MRSCPLYPLSPPPPPPPFPYPPPALSVCSRETIGIGLARVGQDTQLIAAAPLGDLLTLDFGAPLHSLVLAAPPQHLHVLESDILQRIRARPDAPRLAASEERVEEPAP